MVTRALSLESGGTVLPLDGPAVAALPGTAGFGLPPVSVQWWDGAGDGSTYRGSRHGRRVIPLAVLFTGTDADQVAARMSQVAALLAPPTDDTDPLPRLRWDMGPELGAWYTEVVRTGGGDYTWGDDTNGSSWCQVTYTLEAGDPFWTREEATQQTVTSGGDGRGLLGTGRSLTMLRLSSGQAMGTVEVQNPGDVPAYPVVTVQGPGTALTLVSPSGETLTWAGALLAGESRIIDHRAGTIVDGAGVNRYAELGPAPRFWAIPPGARSAQVSLEGADESSSVTLSWRPRRWTVL